MMGEDADLCIKVRSLLDYLWFINYISGEIKEGSHEEICINSYGFTSCTFFNKLQLKSNPQGKQILCHPLSIVDDRASL